jgi:hypothetical protein
MGQVTINFIAQNATIKPQATITSTADESLNPPKSQCCDPSGPDIQKNTENTQSGDSAWEPESNSKTRSDGNPLLIAATSMGSNIQKRDFC